MQNNDNVKQINAFAMRNGIVLGLFGILSLVVLKWSFSIPFCSTLFGVMLLCSPVLATYQTVRFRQAIASEISDFGFMRGFLHALLTGFYASVWVALFTFVYLQYFDHGSIFEAYGHSLNTPEMKTYLRQSGIDAQLAQMTGKGGVRGLVEAMQSLGASTYASFSLYCSLIFGPVIAAVIGLITRK